MASFSKVMIIGNLGRDPEMRYTPNGRAVTEFSVAVNQSTKNQQTGEWVEATDWFRVTVWGDRGERVAEQLRKGNRVFVEGRFRTREYEARDGQKRISLEITADSVVSLDRPGDVDDAGGDRGAARSDVPPPRARPAQSGAAGTEASGTATAGETYEDLDDLPF